MNKLFSKVLVGVAGFAMAFGLNAFAAGEITDLKAVVAEDKTAVTVSGSISGSEDSVEATILVVEQGVSLATVEDAQIRYIDQETAQTGAFSFDFKLETGKVYDVYCGGTDVVAPGKTIADLTSSGKAKLIGKVSLPTGAKYDKVTVKAGEVAGTVDAAGAYTVEVAPGTYTVVVGRPGYLYKTYADVAVTAEGKDLGEIALYAGNLDGNDLIDLDDLSELLKYYQKTEFPAEFDLDDSGEVDLDDLSALLQYYQKMYAE